MKNIIYEDIVKVNYQESNHEITFERFYTKKGDETIALNRWRVSPSDVDKYQPRDGDLIKIEIPNSEFCYFGVLKDNKIIDYDELYNKFPAFDNSGIKEIDYDTYGMFYKINGTIISYPQDRNFTEFLEGVTIMGRNKIPWQSQCKIEEIEEQ